MVPFLKFVLLLTVTWLVTTAPAIGEEDAKRSEARLSLARTAKEMQRRRHDVLYPLWREIPRLRRELTFSGWTLRDIGISAEQLERWIKDHRSALKEAISKKRPTAYRWYELNWPQRCVRR